MAFVSVQYVAPCDLLWQMAELKTLDTPPLPSYMVGLVFVVCLQLLGYGLAGILRRILVWPSEMVWRYNFPYMVFLRTINEAESPLSARWLGLTRFRFFLIVFTAAFVYQWFPSFIFPMLTFFPWWCLIDLSSNRLSQVTGPDGLAMGIIPLNWLTLLGFNLPLVPPWWVHVNIIAGLVLVGYLLIPILYYSNVLDWSNLPLKNINYFAVPDNPNQAQLSIANAIPFYMFLGAMMALVVHTIIFHGRQLLKYARTSLHHRQNDVHCTLIGEYKEAHGWMYGIMFALALTGTCVTCHYAKLMPWYYTFAAAGLGAAFTIPIGLLQALAAVYVYPTYIIYLISGSIFHGRPMYNSTFYIITYTVQNQALAILQNFKLGHYMKIAPQSMFIVQLVSTVISSTLSYVITRHLIADVFSICVNNVDWQCPHLSLDFYSFAIRDFDAYYGLKSVYPWLLWVAVAIGVLPIFLGLVRWFLPSIKWLRYVHIPIIFFGLYTLQYNAYGYLILPTWLLIGFIFNKIIRRWWFDRYGFLFTITMTMGSKAAEFFIFFILIYNNVIFPNWWGTQTSICPLADLSANGSFPNNLMP